MKTYIAILLAISAQVCSHLAFAGEIHESPVQTNAIRQTITTASEPTAMGEWSDSVRDPLHDTQLRGRLIFAEDSVSGGFFVPSIYLDMQNTSPVWATTYLYYDADSSQLRCELRDANDQPVKSDKVVVYDGPIPEIGLLALPYDSILRFKVTLPGFGQATNLITAGRDAWLVSLQDTGDHYLSATLTISTPKTEVRRQMWQGTLKLPPVKIPAITPQKDDSIHSGSTSLNYRDADSGITFSVESDLRHVVATDKDGKTLWRRQPGTDGNLPPYSESRPQTNPAISWIGTLTKEQSERLTNTGSGKFIGIRFNSRQGGVLDVKNGDFTFQGQD